ncbi:MAG: hypothetical protein V8S96_06080 [Lachnospiraceae bacterium]
MITYDTPALRRAPAGRSWHCAAWGRDPETDGQFMKNGKTLLDGLKEFPA